MHQKYEYIGCYKHIHYNCLPNYNLDGSIQDEKLDKLERPFWEYPPQ